LVALEEIPLLGGLHALGYHCAVKVLAHGDNGLCNSLVVAVTRDVFVERLLHQGTKVGLAVGKRQFDVLALGDVEEGAARLACLPGGFGRGTADARK